MPTRTWRGTIDSNWGTSGNWAELAVPGVADDVVFDASSPACTVNASNRVCLSIDFTNYTNMITMSNDITVGNTTGTIFITLGANMSATGSGTLAFSGGGNATFTTNGYTWPTPFRFQGAGQGTTRVYTIITPSNTCSFDGLVTIRSTSIGTTSAGTIQFSGSTSTINLNNGLVFGGTPASALWTRLTATSATTLVFAGGTFDFRTSNDSGFSNNINVNINGSAITLTGNLWFGNTTTGTSNFTYTAGTVNATAFALTSFRGLYTGLNDNVVFNVFAGHPSGQGTGTQGTTINNNDWIKAVTFSTPAGMNANTSGGVTSSIYCINWSGAAAGSSNSTTSLIFYGTGTITALGSSLRDIRFELPADGITTIPANFAVGDSTLKCDFTWVSGYVIANSTITFTNPTTTAANITATGVDFNNVVLAGVGANPTLNLLSDLKLRGNLVLSAGAVLTLTGTFNINVLGSLAVNNPGVTYAYSGTPRIVLRGTGTWTAAANTFGIPLEINTPGTITIPGTVQKTDNLIYTRGRVICASGSNIQCAGTGFTNMHRIPFRTVTLTGNITMNEFFSGRPGVFCNVVSSAPGTARTVTFSDDFPKVARWVTPTNVTLARRGQLTIMSRNGNRSSSNTGFLYFEGASAGLPKNNPVGYQAANYFGIGDNPADPVFF